VGHSPGLCPWVACGFLRKASPFFLGKTSPTIEKPSWGGKKCFHGSKPAWEGRRANKSLEKKRKERRKGGKYFFEDKSYFLQFSVPWLGSLSAPVNA